MAIYHMNISNISRGKGQSSLASLSYISGMRCTDERTGKHYYGYGIQRRERVAGTAVYLVPGMPESWAKCPDQLFNSIEIFENSDSARVAKRGNVALPREWIHHGKLTLRGYGAVNEFAKSFTDHGVAVVISYHDLDSNNPHFHFECPNREWDSQKNDWSTKVKIKKIVARDEHGNRIPVIDPATGEQKVRVRKGKGSEPLWKRETVSANWLDSKTFVTDLRQSWEECCNRHLEPERQVSSQSYQSRGVQRVPERHNGYSANEIEARTGQSTRVARNRVVDAVNGFFSHVQPWLMELSARKMKRALWEQQRAQEQQQQEEPYPWLKQRDHVIRFANGTTADLNDLAREAIEEANEPEPPKKNPPKRRRKPYGGR